MDWWLPLGEGGLEVGEISDGDKEVQISNHKIN